MTNQEALRSNGTFLLLIMAVCLWSSTGSTVLAAAPSGETVFKSNCVACHAGGKNTMDPKKPIVGSKMLASVDDFKGYISKGKGAMPPFPQIANDGESLQALYKYCKSLK